MRATPEALICYYDIARQAMADDTPATAILARAMPDARMFFATRY